jgi:hypothetical protein
MRLNDASLCLFCLNPSGARLGLDKKGRPYVHCIACGARSFLPSFSPCLNGIAVLAPLAHAVLEEMGRDREAWERVHGQVATFLAQLRAQIAGARASAVEGSARPDGLAPVTTAIVRPA